MTIQEYTHHTEAAARDARRAFINSGRSVSLLAYDSNREVYVFDVID